MENGTRELPDGGVYEGMMDNGNPGGVGRYSWGGRMAIDVKGADGNNGDLEVRIDWDGDLVFKGMMKTSGDLDGLLEWPDGKSYEGHIDVSGEDKDRRSWLVRMPRSYFDGLELKGGKMAWDDGTVYTGDFVKMEPNGQGLFEFEDRFYEGWVQPLDEDNEDDGDLIEIGSDKYIFEDSDGWGIYLARDCMYRGEMEDESPCGVGHYRWKDGTRIDSDNDINFHRYVITWPNGVEVSGFWDSLKMMLNGGPMKWPDGKMIGRCCLSCKYAGHSERTAEGILFSDYNGFKLAFMDHYMTWPDGTQYVGEYTDFDPRYCFLPKGKGTFKFPDGTVFAGNVRPAEDGDDPNIIRVIGEDRFVLENDPKPNGAERIQIRDVPRPEEVQRNVGETDNMSGVVPEGVADACHTLSSGDTVTIKGTGNGPVKQVVYQWADGDRFEGEVFGTKLRVGVYRWTQGPYNGCSFDGDWRDGKPRGSFYDSNGKKKLLAPRDMVFKEPRPFDGL